MIWVYAAMAAGEGVDVAVGDGFTIHIYVPDGDPTGVRIVERMNWTGLVTVIPRSRWREVRSRDDLLHAGVYILVGYGEEDDDEIPSVYIGEADTVRHRLDQHYRKLEFWERVIVLTAGTRLNKAHVKWLEATLVEKAKTAHRSKVTNPGGTNRPRLSEAEAADMEAFLREALLILPLVDVPLFESVDAVTPGTDSVPQMNAGPDTVVVPARLEGFNDVFLGQREWRAIRVRQARLPQLKYIAAYQVQPVSAVTHFAKVRHLEPYGIEGKYRVVFDGEPIPLEHPIPFGDAPKGAMQSPRYTTLAKLKAAQTLSDVF